MSFRMPALTALLTAGILALAGCVPAPGVVLPVEPSGVQPVFASDEEALAAAVAAYGEYMLVSGQIGADGGEDVGRIKELVTEALFDSEAASFKELRDSGGYQEGLAQLENYRLQQFWEEPGGVAYAIAYFCVDLRSVRFFDSSGNDVTNPERSDQSEVEVLFHSSGTDAKKLVISEVTPWLGSGICS